MRKSTVSLLNYVKRADVRPKNKKYRPGEKPWKTNILEAGAYKWTQKRVILKGRALSWNIPAGNKKLIILFHYKSLQDCAKTLINHRPNQIPCGTLVLKHYNLIYFDLKTKLREASATIFFNLVTLWPGPEYTLHTCM